MIDVEPLIASELERMLPLPTGNRADWGDVSQRARRSHTASGRRRKPLLVAATTAAALVGAGVAIAAGFGAFNGLSRAQAQAGPAIVDAQTMVAIHTACNPPSPAPPMPAWYYNPYCHLVLDSARLLTDSPPWGKTYVIADTRGEVCVFGRLGGCYPPLSRTHPITFGGGNAAPTEGGTFFAAGLAMDGVTSISFTPVPGSGKQVTVPVKDNIWVYHEPDSHADVGHCIVAHFADGSSINPFLEVPCP